MLYKKLGLTCVMLGASVLLSVERDPLYGAGLVLLVAGTTLLREIWK